ncbi:hypothetical protein EVAR_54508_1 [Eumeta japonica]|uniref:Uncharacterized protein n=1 Tax=Eumeta variegata TaxID=151549 RepID=A0A4C1YM52_EUMVA|nr:hypothetical protein EVAR_54508_1 [Eumeta japonica]
MNEVSMLNVTECSQKNFIAVRNKQPNIGGLLAHAALKTYNPVGTPVKQKGSRQTDTRTGGQLSGLIKVLLEKSSYFSKPVISFVQPNRVSVALHRVYYVQLITIGYAQTGHKRITPCHESGSSNSELALHWPYRLGRNGRDSNAV